MDGIDTTVKAVSTVANAALPKSGGNMTGQINALTATAVVTALTSQTGTVTITTALGTGWTITFSGNPTFVFTGLPTGFDLACFVLRVTALGSRTPTWPASVKWDAGTQPTWTTGVDVIAFITFDGGTTWHGKQAMADSR